VEITPITRGIARHQSICWLEASITVSLRRAEDPSDLILFCCNFTPAPHQGHEFGVPEEGLHQEILDTDSELFGGTNKGNGNSVRPHCLAHNVERISASRRRSSFGSPPSTSAVISSAASIS